MNNPKVKEGTDKVVREFHRCFIPGGECNNKCPIWMEQTASCSIKVIAASLLTISKK